MKRIALAGAALLMAAGMFLLLRPAPHAPAMQVARQIAARADVMSAVAQHNMMSSIDLAALDAQWRQERAQQGGGKLINTLLASKLSQRLAGLRHASKGQILQIMVMDARGALVAADAAAHDYDQSDEPKWQLTVGKAETKPVLEFAEPHGDAKLYQISKSVLDSKGTIIGAITLVWCSKAGSCQL